MNNYKYTDKEINAILKTLTIISDTREQTNQHILHYLNEKKIPVRIQKIDSGDYGCLIPQNIEMGIMRDVYLDTYVERKAHIDEICGNLSKANQAAFVNELIRSQNSKFVLFVEDENFDKNLASDTYRSKYDPKALKGRLESLKVKYDFEIVPMTKEMIPHNIYWRMYYHARHYLKYGKL